ncbi:hypothetical protein [Bosea beijingensis]
MQQAEPVFQRAQAFFGGLGFRGGVEQRLVEGGAIGADRSHFLFEIRASLGISGETLLDRLELAFAGLLLDELLHRLALQGFRVGLGRLGEGGGRTRQQGGKAQAAQSGANQQGHTR